MTKKLIMIAHFIAFACISIGTCSCEYMLQQYLVLEVLIKSGIAAALLLYVFDTHEMIQHLLRFLMVAPSPKLCHKDYYLKHNYVTVQAKIDLIRTW